MTKNPETPDFKDYRVPPSSEILNIVATEVPEEDILKPAVQTLIDTMYQVAHGRQGDANRRTMVGLAAPQIGESKRIILVGINAAGTGEQPDLRELINPIITKTSLETDENREGCFSTSLVCGIVERAQKVTVEAYDRQGQKVVYELEGFPARVAQHEIDHLNGIRFPDRIKDDSKLHWVEESEFGQYRTQWQNWQVTCPRKDWEDIKSGKK